MPRRPTARRPRPSGGPGPCTRVRDLLGAHGSRSNRPKTACRASSKLRRRLPRVVRRGVPGVREERPAPGRAGRGRPRPRAPRAPAPGSRAAPRPRRSRATMVGWDTPTSSASSRCDRPRRRRSVARRSPSESRPGGSARRVRGRGAPARPATSRGCPGRPPGAGWWVPRGSPRWRADPGSGWGVENQAAGGFRFPFSFVSLWDFIGVVVVDVRA